MSSKPIWNPSQVGTNTFKPKMVIIVEAILTSKASNNLFSLPLWKRRSQSSLSSRFKSKPVRVHGFSNKKIYLRSDKRDVRKKEMPSWESSALAPLEFSLQLMYGLVDLMFSRFPGHKLRSSQQPRALHPQIWSLWLIRTKGCCYKFRPEWWHQDPKGYRAILQHPDRWNAHECCRSDLRIIEKYADRILVNVEKTERSDHPNVTRWSILFRRNWMLTSSFTWYARE